MRTRLVPLASLALIATAASGQEAVVQSLPRFKAIELVGGGKVTLRPGPAQRVAVSNTHPERTRMEVAAPDRLNAAVSMGDMIGYRGDPRVTQAVSMGDAVRRIGDQDFRRGLASCGATI